MAPIVSTERSPRRAPMWPEKNIPPAVRWKAEMDTDRKPQRPTVVNTASDEAATTKSVTTDAL